MLPQSSFTLIFLIEIELTYNIKVLIWHIYILQYDYHHSVR